MLIDEAHISIKAGDGGDGIVHFLHTRHQPKGGPDGGDGGDGGSVYFEAVSDISKLHQFRHKRKFEVENGAPGGPKQKTGAGGSDLVLEVPIGTVINYDNGTSIELSYVGQKEMVAGGGKGGRGNFHFRAADNHTPLQSTPGQRRPYRDLFLQLKLIANVGLIGLPNAGKTSLLNELTSANAKVANYAFTTLEPNLGAAKGGYIIADIPGLIEGAADGKGLGFRFLKHIERTSLLIHCISSESTDPVADYKIIRRELENYSATLAKKPEIIVLTKSDLLDSPEIENIKNKINARLVVSIIDNNSIKQLSDLITKSLK